ncbi:MAG: amidohydrolase family protein [Planctomycetes bacterium]|nr:amidohydrolase family protein [Planctomycetota bacterium]HPF13430.1 amidohydrolase family protein [Planctomycetota bacterium]
MMRPMKTLALAALLAGASDRASAQTEAKSSGASGSVYADVLYTSTGKTFENVLVTFQDGRITTITPGAKVDDQVPHGAALTAGMVDLSARVARSEASVEQTNEVEASLSVAGALDLFDPNWARLAATGVTTVLASPPDRNVVGGLSAILKTQGPTDIAERQLTGRSFLRGAMGDAPSSGNRPAWGAPNSIYNRRPTTRMGVEWEWRKAFIDAASAPDYPELEFPGADVFRAVLAGNVTLFVQAFTSIDIRTAVFLKEEMKREGFGDIQMWIDSGAEAWKDPQLLKRSNSGVVLPPFPADGYSGENSFMAWDVAKQMDELGIPFTLSAYGSFSLGSTLGDQAGRAMHGGLAFDKALAAVTLVPARVLGLEDRIGSVEVGKDADLVLWSGPPFELTSRVLAVWVSGTPVTQSSSATR